MTVRLQSEPFDPGAETNAFLAEAKGAGAAVTFTGLVRSLPGESVQSLQLECYVPLAEKQLVRFVSEASERFGLLRAVVIHRFGRLQPGEPIVQVMTLSPHRRAAFEGAEFLMDRLKTDAPFWKREERPEGTKWIEAKPEDDKAAARWTAAS